MDQYGYCLLFSLSICFFLSCIHFSYYLLFVFRFILQHGGRVILADEMGLGKTLQVIHCLKLNYFHTCTVPHGA